MAYKKIQLLLYICDKILIKVIILLLLLPPAVLVEVEDVHDYVINQIFWCVRSFYKKEMS